MSYRTFGKRFLDVVVAALSLIVLSPLFGLLALAVLWLLGGPALFRQQRAGLGGQPFTIYKFRTMLDLRAPDGRLLPDEQRLSRLGRLLRATSLDELPELVNVLRGDMSLVGPRPLYTRYVPLYDKVQARRQEVRPGITGWAQVKGRNALSWESRFALDVWYVDHLSLWLDLKVIVGTVGAVLRAQGISAAGHATMPEFLGTGRQG